MRLFRLVRSVSAIRVKSFFLVTAGAGMLSTADVAKAAEAHVLRITAKPEGPVPKMSDEILVFPAQPMANDPGQNVSVLPRVGL
jgi:hypothetical protein